MAAQAREFFGDVTAVSEISNFLRETAGVKLDRLPAARNQFPNAFLQSLPVNVNQVRCGTFYNGHFDFHFCEADAHLFVAIALRDLVRKPKSFFRVVTEGADFDQLGVPDWVKIETPFYDRFGRNCCLSHVDVPNRF